MEFFRYNPGALISYWDTSYSDNNVGDHPGGGEILPVDAHPTFTPRPGRLAPAPADAVLRLDVLHDRRARSRRSTTWASRSRCPAKRAVPLFDDTLDWWFSRDEHTVGTHPGHYQPGWYSVDVPKTGTTIRVVDVNKKTHVMTVRVGTSRLTHRSDRPATVPPDLARSGGTVASGDGSSGGEQQVEPADGEADHRRQQGQLAGERCFSGSSLIARSWAAMTPTT